MEEDRVVHAAAVYGPVYSKGPGDTRGPTVPGSLGDLMATNWPELWEGG